MVNSCDTRWSLNAMDAISIHCEAPDNCKKRPASTSEASSHGLCGDPVLEFH